MNLLFVLIALPALVLSQGLLDVCLDVQGVKHKIDDSYIGTDGCNKCKCLATGSACTRKFCNQNQPKIAAEANQCVDNLGNLHEENELSSYTHVDGCNTCVCKSFGGMCTKKFCLNSREVAALCVDIDGQQRKGGESWLADDGCNKCTCGSLGPICTMMECPKRRGGDIIKTPNGDIVDETGDSPCRLENGSTKFPGDTWLTEDSCNACTCTGMNGKVDCTSQGCRATFLRLTNPEKYNSRTNGATVVKFSSVLSVLLLVVRF